MAEESSTLRSWMKKEDIFDKDVESILGELGVADPESDFKNFTQQNWDDLWRRAVVERAKELKDQQAKVRLEKKMAKLEAFWRKESGIVKTSIKPSSKAAKDDEKAESQANIAQQQELIEKAAELKKFMQANDCYNVDLLAVLSDHGVNKEDDIVNIQTNMEWGTISREFRVKQRGKLKDQLSKTRADRTLTKFEKIWRKKTGIKSTSIKDDDSEAKKDDAPKTKKNKEMAGKGKALKEFMKKSGFWQMALYEELLAADITDADAVKNLSEKDFDEIVRKVRIERFKDLKDQTARGNADKLLVKFEKYWRKESGIKKTSLKKK